MLALNSTPALEERATVDERAAFVFTAGRTVYRYVTYAGTERSYLSGGRVISKKSQQCCEGFRVLFGIVVVTQSK